MTIKYTPDHEWLQINADGTAIVGITHHAQDALGDVVFVETPEAGKTVSVGDSFAVVESVKAASDVYAPVAGEIIGSNQEAVDAPEAVTADAYATWLFKLKPANAADVDALLDAAGYEAAIG